MTKSSFLILIILVVSSQIYPQNKMFKLNGKVLDSSELKPLENCNVSIPELKIGTNTNDKGEFSIELRKGSYKIIFSYVGFSTFDTIAAIFDKDIYLTVLLNSEIINSKEINVTAKREQASIVVQKLDQQNVKKNPTINSDVLRSVQILSGVTTNNELTSGYNVRGGSFDENLIYLNGYEIYRPFLLRIGIEESQTIINPNMVYDLIFYNGAFPAGFGDKMSSALEVNYKIEQSEKLNGTAYASLLNSGLNLNNKISDFSWSLSTRYAYPSNFLKNLQNRGDYKSSYSDIQFLGNYKLSNSADIQFLGIYADNKFDVLPTNWKGGFGYKTRNDYRGISIKSDGERTYSYLNRLLGLKLLKTFSDNSSMNLSFSNYWILEKENFDISSDIFYFPVYSEPNSNLVYLKSRFEKGNNFVELSSYKIKTEYKKSFTNHNIYAGSEYQLAQVKNKNFENSYEVGDSLVNEKPVYTDYNGNFNLNSFNLFIEDYILLSSKLEANIGVRYLNYNYSNENLISPRAYLTYRLSEANSFKLSWGYYYQPPFINELRNTKSNNLKSQRAIHYIFGWERKISEKKKYNIEIYYKDLYNLIPFYFDEFRMLYVENNNREGFAYGLDFMYEGEIVEGMNSWIGYSYLNTKERKIGTNNSYQRRLFDQTHTIQIFLQDRFRKHRNWQSHLRFLFGSGYLYYQRKLTTDETSGSSYIDVDFNNPQEYFLYFRVDMGLSAKLDLGNEYYITPIVEVLNVFNQSNHGAYEWIQIFKDIKAPIGIPHLLSPRFFNLRVELSF